VNVITVDRVEPVHAVSDQFKEMEEASICTYDHASEYPLDLLTGFKDRRLKSKPTCKFQFFSQARSRRGRV
jgi:hypothetical protein